MTDKTLEERNAIIRKKMVDIENIRIEKMPMDSPWMRPARMSFRQNGKEKCWDLSRVHDSVAIVVFNITRKKLIFVRQFRPATYCAILPEKFQVVDTNKYPLDAGLTLELCAGIVDKDVSLPEIASIELLEECGYEAPPDAFQQIVSYREVGGIVSKQTLFYIEVTDEMHKHPGGGAESEGEFIEIVEMTAEQANNYITSGDVHSPPALLYGVLWFLVAKKDRYC